MIPAKLFNTMLIILLVVGIAVLVYRRDRQNQLPAVRNNTDYTYTSMVWRKAKKLTDYTENERIAAIQEHINYLAINYTMTYRENPLLCYYSVDISASVTYEFYSDSGKQTLIIQDAGLYDRNHTELERLTVLLDTKNIAYSIKRSPGNSCWLLEYATNTDIYIP